MAASLIVGEELEAVRIRGRIDRIDVLRCGEQFAYSIIDYKTGVSVPGEKAVARGEAMQLPLYALATQQLGMHEVSATGLVASYWTLREGGFRKTLMLGDAAEQGWALRESWVALAGRVEGRVLELARGIRAGEFPVASRDKHCTSYCRFARICRVGQLRRVKQAWRPADEAESEAVGEEAAE